MGGGSAGGGGGVGGGSSGGSSSLSSTSLSSLASTPQITAPGNTSGGTSNTISQSNFLATTYANPYYQGVLTNQQSSNNMPGGFGTPTYGTSGTSSMGGGSIGFAGSTTGTAGASGASGARTGSTGSRTSSTNSTTYLVPNPVQISYRAVLSPEDFKTESPAVIGSQLQTDIAAMIRRSPGIVNPSTIQVSADGNVVTLRGTVETAKEAKLISNMVWMSPGVHGVKNELSPLKQ